MSRVSAKPWSNLQPYRPRRFVPPSIDWGDWAQVEPYFDELDRRVAAATNPAELERWLLDWGEISAALDEEQARRYVAMTCQTDDAAAEQAYLRMVEEIEPRTKPRHFRLEQAYLAHPQRKGLPDGRYAVYDRATQAHVELFREANVPLETEEAKVGQQYQKLSGSLTVQFRGEERTLVQMGRLLEETDRALRQEAWELVMRRRLAERDRFEDLFDELLRLREAQARNAGFENYRDYAFRRLGRFDYGPAECLAFHEAVEQEIMPLVRQFQAERRGQLGLDSLRPWDLAVDPLGRPPLRPFDAASQLVGRTQLIFDRMDPALGNAFRTLDRMGLLDLENRKGKAPGGYLQPLGESRLAFIFMNAVGVHRDVETLLHEAGHAFHALATQPEDFYPYRNAPIEFCEVASMSMELVGQTSLDAFYPEAEGSRARRTHLEGVIGFFPWMATVDAFQHWIYTHPGNDRIARRAVWRELMLRFGGEVDWQGYEEGRDHSWHRQLHIFLHPFYYVEYGIAQLGALQVWRNYRNDPGAALRAYRDALALGGSRPLPDLFAAAGARFDFSRAAVRPLMAMAREAMAQAE